MVNVKKASKSWQVVAQEAQRYRDASLAKVQPPCSDIPERPPLNVFETIRSCLPIQEVGITELAPERLLEMLRSGKLTAVTVTKAFLRRAVLAQKMVSLEPSNPSRSIALNYSHVV